MSRTSRADQQTYEIAALLILQQNPGFSLTTREVRRQCQRLGERPTWGQIKGALGRLAEQGKIVRTTRGHYCYEWSTKETEANLQKDIPHV